ncbi:hypothetical protein [Rhizobium leguminosarum]|uniref:hypothetical protein n=1 Tax=Rhizobium leguminosarum TaxID=384 RepID=UPI00048675CC|nr:hypothetical protein [Rhizobium leguminosarum]WFT91119.1 hypothetical protein QA638_38665 [Rhizobium leguminosarum]
MAKARSASSFFMMVVDQDEKRFSVEGPTSDDTKWYEARERAVATGRNIDVHPYQNQDSLVNGKLPEREDIIEGYKRDPHLRHLKNVRPGTILGKHMFK